MSPRPFSSTPPAPSPSVREGGSTPHPAVHVRERRDHSPRGEWYLARRTLWQVLEKLRAGALPCYKEFASLMLFLDSYPPVPLSTWKGGKRIASASAPVRAQPARKARKRKEQENSRRSFPALFVSAASGCRGCARGGAIQQSRVKRCSPRRSRLNARDFPQAYSVVSRTGHAQKPD